MTSLGSSKLREWRGARSLAAVAMMVPAHRVAWYDWECGKRVPNKRMMPRLLHIVPGLTADDFYTAAEPAAIQDAA